MDGPRAGGVRGPAGGVHRLADGGTGGAGWSALQEFGAARARRRRARLLASVGAPLMMAAGFALLIRSAGAGGRIAGAALALAGALGGRLAWRVGSDAERWLDGASAEQATARYLSSLPRRGWSVWHDLRVPGSRANIDHVVIGPPGVWVVDTKSTRSPIRAGWWSVRLGDRPLDPTATKWEAEVVSDRLGVKVRPIVALHGPGMRRRAGRAGGIAVVRADRLVPRLRRGRRQLGRAEVERLGVLLVEHFSVNSGTSRG
jgi:hypothetical protein